MWQARCAVVAAALLTVGCAGAIAERGTDIGRLTSRDRVRADFGVPDRVTKADGRPVDVFHTHRKLARPKDGWALTLYAGYSFGLTDLVFVPVEVTDLLANAVAGQELCFVYDAAGNVVEVLLDGRPGPDRLFGGNPSGLPANEPNEDPNAKSVSLALQD